MKPKYVLKNSKYLFYSYDLNINILGKKVFNALQFTGFYRKRHHKIQI